MPDATGHPPSGLEAEPLQQFSYPKGIALEPGTGRIFIAETYAANENSGGTFPQRVVAIAPDDSGGDGETIVGGLDPEQEENPHLVDGEPANESSLTSLSSIAFDDDGDLYLVLRDVVWKIPRDDGPEGRVTGEKPAVFVAGSSSSADTGVHPGDAYIGQAAAVAFDQTGAMFIAHRHRVIRVDPGDDAGFDGDGDLSETFTSVAGLTVSEHTGGGFTEDGVPARSSALSHPMGISFDRFGNLLIADTCNHRIRKVSTGENDKVDGDSTEIITTVAGRGSGRQGMEPGGCLHRPVVDTPGGFNENELGNTHPRALEADLNMPRSVLEDPFGNLLIADSRNDRIRRVSAGDDGRLTGNHPAIQPDPQEVIDTVVGDQSVVMPYGLIRRPCPETEVLASEWIANGSIKLLRGLVQCPHIDLGLEEIVDTPDPGTVGSELKYSVKATNAGPSEATGVNMTSTLPATVAFKSATSPRGECALHGPAVDMSGGSVAGSRVICSLGRLTPGQSLAVEIVVTPNAPDEKLSFEATVRAENPEETEDVLPNSKTEQTEVVLPDLPPLPPLPSLPDLLEFLSDGGGGSTNGPPLQEPGPVGRTPVDPNQSSLSVTAPPGGPGSAAPSTVPVPVTSAQPGGGQVPLTGSLGFQQGQASVPDSAPATSAAADSQLGMAGATAGAAAVAGVPEEQTQAAPRYSMVAAEGALYAWAGFATGAVLLSALACVLVAGSAATPIRPVPGWGYAAGRGPRNGGRPAV